MKSQIISIGDELLLGDTVNTNASWLGQVLTGHGVTITKVQMIPDNESQIRQAVTESMQQADLVITTGGLGPTHDDITKKTVADIFEVQMVIHQPTLDFIRKIFKKRNIPFSKSNYYQAEVPENCEVLFNKQGTAPGLWFEEDGSRLAVLPGIPYEMKNLINYKVLPRIAAFTEGLGKTFSRHIKVAGVGESTLTDEVLGPLDDFLSDDISVAFLPSPRANTIRVNTLAVSKEEADQKSKLLVKFIYDKAGKYVIGEGKELTLSEAVGSVLREQSLTISTAESCTGGLLADTITDISGSSDYFMGGMISYADRIKTAELGVPEKVLKEHGAVSKPTALEMAKGVARSMGTDIGVSTTGIAGPEGGTEEKPVGTVWIGFWSKNHHFALKTTFTNDRQVNKERSVAVALETVRRTVREIEPMPYGLKPDYA